MSIHIEKVKDSNPPEFPWNILKIKGAIGLSALLRQATFSYWL
jgi:hypothetical protein